MIMRLAFLLFMTATLLQAASPGERFAQAADAYDRQDYDEASALFRSLLDDGFRSAELYYNAANALYRQGQTGWAVLHYRKALYLAPRDPDIRHNLAFVLHEADAIEVQRAWPIRFLRRVSLAEWIAVATVSGWLTALYLGLMLWPGPRHGWGFTASLMLTVLLISLAGIYQWLNLQLHPEVVVVKADQEALFAPLEGSTAFFTLPEGSIAGVDAQMDGWYKIMIGDKSGWLRRSAVSPVASRNRQEN